MKEVFGIFFITWQLSATPMELLVIGDSQSEEYAFELPFSAPDSNPLAANTRNWVELLADQRPAEVSFGSYRPQLLSYPDVRNGGFSQNWGVPTFETENWKDVVTSSLFENQFLFSSRLALVEQLPRVDAVVIILGGNDANGDYRALQNNTPPENWGAQIASNLKIIIDSIQQSTDQPIYVANIPDVGATALVQRKFPDPEKRAIATEFIKDANAQIAALTQAEGATLIDFFSLTERINTPGPVRIGQIEFFPFEHPENKNRYLLCKDGFHPSTATQALLANLILEALSLTPLSDAEILEDILGISPTADDQYLAWIEPQTDETSFLADPDGNGMPNLGEYALDRSQINIAGQIFSYRPDPERSSYVEILPTISSDLREWVPPLQRFTADDGTVSITSPRPFFRLTFDIR